MPNYMLNDSDVNAMRDIRNRVLGKRDSGRVDRHRPEYDEPYTPPTPTLPFTVTAGVSGGANGLNISVGTIYNAYTIVNAQAQPAKPYLSNPIGDTTFVSTSALSTGAHQVILTPSGFIFRTGTSNKTIMLPGYFEVIIASFSMSADGVPTEISYAGKDVILRDYAAGPFCPYFVLKAAQTQGSLVTSAWTDLLAIYVPISVRRVIVTQTGMMGDYTVTAVGEIFDHGTILNTASPAATTYSMSYSPSTEEWTLAEGSGDLKLFSLADTGSSGFVYLLRWAYGTISKITAN
ncbi:hypothetical protein SDC9_132925 [bioreactor metagenome]|uniref:Uncharacterized protein n=1 Tax=bioreactor metagenome TaxID=1076179 RepID=A0A645DB93_9ZZZZ